MNRPIETVTSNKARVTSSLSSFSSESSNESCSKSNWQTVVVLVLSSSSVSSPFESAPWSWISQKDWTAWVAIQSLKVNGTTIEIRVVGKKEPKKRGERRKQEERKTSRVKNSQEGEKWTSSTFNFFLVCSSQLQLNCCPDYIVF